MLIFHEGLPGSGKSFAAMVDHIVPALKKGRAVYAYIEGLNNEKIAEVSGLTLERVEELLHYVTRDQVPMIHANVKNDSLVVIDELQNFWPLNRQRLDADITQFVTEHRHRGLDILAMGQVVGDCHALWKGRIDTLITFRKLDAIGKPDEYRWSVQKNVGKGKFKETTTGKKNMIRRISAVIWSHTEDTTNTGTYVDDRANVKNSKTFGMIKYYGLAVVAAICVLVYIFKGGGLEGNTAKPAPVAKTQPKPVTQPVQQVAQTQPVAVQPVAEKKPAAQNPLEEKFVDLVVTLTEKNRMRLSGVIKGKAKTSGSIEWRDQSNRLVEQITFDQLQGFGWFVMVSVDGSVANVTRPGHSYIATQWPLQDDRERMPSRVPEQSIQDMKQHSAPPVQSIPAPSKVASAV